MAQELLQSRPEYGRTFSTALWLLGGLGSALVLAAGWAVLTRPLPPRAVAGAQALPQPVAEIATAAETPARIVPPVPVLPVSPATLAMSLPATMTMAGSEFSPPPPLAASVVPTGPVPGPRLNGPETVAPLSTLLTEAALGAPPILRIPDPEVAGLIDTGVEWRASGNTLSALDSLRQAEALLPEHPRVLAEIAATFGEMGLDAKASLYWERVRDLGPDKAGTWHAIAIDELSGRRAAKAPPILRLGKVNVLRDPAIKADQGERVVLGVSIMAEPHARPSPAEMSMLVYFYDLVDGATAEASTADTAQNFVSPPYDWQEHGVETIEVIYHQAVFSPEQKQELGERAYYGYIIELYYRDELQDTAAFPPDLRNPDPKATPSSMSEQPLGPENSLFPTAPQDE